MFTYKSGGWHGLCIYKRHISGFTLNAWNFLSLIAYFSYVDIFQVLHRIPNILAVTTYWAYVLC